jgi:hypothetical protein
MGATLRDGPDRKVTWMAGSSSPDYERRFIEPERLFSMDTSRIPNHDHEHVMWGQDIYTLGPDMFSSSLSWTTAAA